MLPPCVAWYPYFCVWTVVLGMHIMPNIVLVALILLGLLDKNLPIVGASPPFLGPPHTLVLLIIEA
jgi:hypothetical protein